MAAPILDLADLNLEFEIVAGSLREGSLPDDINPAHFAGERTRWLAQKIEMLGTSTCTPILLSELRREGRVEEVPAFEEMLNRLYAQHIDTGRTEDAAKRVVELATGRKLASMIDPANPANITIKLRDQRVTEVMGELEAFLFAEHAMKGVVAEGDAIATGGDVLAEIARRRAIGGFSGIPTYIDPIDEIIDGLMPGEYGLIAGGTGEGKSLGLLDISARAWKNGHNVAFVSIEMGKLQQDFRFLCWNLGFEIQKFRRPENLSDADVERIRQFYAEREAMPNTFYWIDVPENVSASQIERKLLQVERKLGLRFDVVAVDYMGIMSPIGSFKSRTDWDAMAQTSWDLHQLARRQMYCVWSAVQKKESLSDAAKKRGGLESIGLSYMIPQPADICLVLTEKTMEGFMEVNVAKGRDVPKARAKLHPDLRRARLHRDTACQPCREAIRSRSVEVGSAKASENSSNDRL